MPTTYKHGHQKNIKKAVWQFILDHAIKRGQTYQVKFGTSGFGDLWKRIEARGDGIHRNTEQSVNDAFIKREDTLFRKEEHQRKLNSFFKGIERGNNYWLRFVRYFNKKSYDYLISIYEARTKIPKSFQSVPPGNEAGGSVRTETDAH